MCAKYFDSISHELLKRPARAADQGRAIAGLDGADHRFVSRGFRPGLPIGSLTSQHFANFYLDRFDRFVKEDLRIRVMCGIWMTW